MCRDRAWARRGWLLGPLLAVLVAGCGGSAQPPYPGRKITIEEYNRMSPAERDDPYVTDNLEKPPPKEGRKSAGRR